MSDSRKRIVEELELSQLENIAGGRQPNKTELNDWQEVLVKVIVKTRHLRVAGDDSAADDLEESYRLALRDWFDRIHKTDDHENILFSEMFRF